MRRVGAALAAVLLSACLAAPDDGPDLTLVPDSSPTERVESERPGLDAGAPVDCPTEDEFREEVCVGLWETGVCVAHAECPVHVCCRRERDAGPRDAGSSLDPDALHPCETCPAE